MRSAPQIAVLVTSSTAFLESAILGSGTSSTFNSLGPIKRKARIQTSWLVCYLGRLLRVRAGPFEWGPAHHLLSAPPAEVTVVVVAVGTVEDAGVVHHLSFGRVRHEVHLENRGHGV